MNLVKQLKEEGIREGIREGKLKGGTERLLKILDKVMPQIASKYRSQLQAVKSEQELDKLEEKILQEIDEAKRI